jgi:hypothetical protein
VAVVRGLATDRAQQVESLVGGRGTQPGPARGVAVIGQALGQTVRQHSSVPSFGRLGSPGSTAGPMGILALYLEVGLSVGALQNLQTRTVEG